MVMAHGLNSSVIKRGGIQKATDAVNTKTGIGSRRIFPPHFKLQVLDSYRGDADCKGNQRATARKYGIHRRQIQKWLQAETNLRSTVNNNNNSNSVNNNTKCRKASPSPPVLDHNHSGDGCINNNNKSVCVAVALAPHRQRDAHTYAQRAVSPATAAPLDCSTHTRCPATPADNASPVAVVGIVPIDLSVKRVAGASSTTAPVRQRPTESLPISVADLSSSTSTSPLAQLPQPSEIWDLSTTQRIKQQPRVSLSPQQPQLSLSPQQPQLSLTPQQPQLSLTPQQPQLSLSPQQPQLSPQPPVQVQREPKPLFKPYLLDEKPSTTGTIITNNCNYNSYEPMVKIETTPMDTYYYHHPHLCEAGMDVGYVFDESGVLQPTTYLRHALHMEQQHQRQSYSLDFKLRTIDSYYRDEYCKGNQRAVAFKYNIHRRQVQKWLKQEDDLRERRESRHTHIVT